jgi:large subunit ribosomal protein L35
MFKIKTRKSAAKRYKKTATKNFIRKHAYKSHLLGNKTSAQKRKLSTSICVKKTDRKSIKLMLPY